MAFFAATVKCCDHAQFFSYLCISGTSPVKMLELQQLKIGVTEMGSLPIHNTNAKGEKACDLTSLIFSCNSFQDCLDKIKRTRRLPSNHLPRFHLTKFAEKKSRLQLQNLSLLLTCTNANTNANSKKTEVILANMCVKLSSFYATFLMLHFS